MELKVRKQLRKDGYIYSKEGYYFITICIKNRECILSRIELDKIKLTEIGEIVNRNLQNIEKIYNNVIIDEYVIMPNHIHIILRLCQREKETVSQIIQQLKMIVTKNIGYSIWQRSFYERVIRNEKEYINIKEYIINNPINWKQDEYF